MAALLFVGCTNRQENDYEAGLKYSKKKEWPQAVIYFERTILRDRESPIALKAMKEAARIEYLQVKDYKRAAQYYQDIIVHSPREEERLDAQKQLAAIYFESLQDYERAAVEYSKLVTSSRVDSERAAYKLLVARSQYFLGNYFQALSEIDEILKLRADQETEFQARLLRGNVYVAEKKFPDAAKVFSEVIDKFPEKSLKENVHLVLSLAYEENGDYKQAISILEKIKDIYQPKEYIELRLKRIKERAHNQPGARGYRK